MACSRSRASSAAVLTGAGGFCSAGIGRTTSRGVCFGAGCSALDVAFGVSAGGAGGRAELAGGVGATWAIGCVAGSVERGAPPQPDSAARPDAARRQADQRRL
jgi:hypothetical protein